MIINCMLSPIYFIAIYIKQKLFYNKVLFRCICKCIFFFFLKTCILNENIEKTRKWEVGIGVLKYCKYSSQSQLVGLGFEKLKSRKSGERLQTLVTRPPNPGSRSDFVKFASN